MKLVPERWMHEFYCPHCDFAWVVIYTDDARLGQYCAAQDHPKYLAHPIVTPYEDNTI